MGFTSRLACNETSIVSHLSLLQVSHASFLEEKVPRVRLVFLPNCQITRFTTATTRIAQ